MNGRVIIFQKKDGKIYLNFYRNLRLNLKNYVCVDVEEAYKLTKQYFTSIFEEVGKKEKKKFVLEKNTFSFLNLDTIFEIYPPHKVINIYRDPRDVVASYCKQSWMPSSPEQSAIMLNKMYKKWWEVEKNIPQEKILNLSFDKLVDDPRKMIEECCKFWDIDFDKFVKFKQIQMEKRVF